MMLASLETQSGLAPGSHRTGVTNRCAALATAVGVVAGVHNGTTAAGTNAHVALTAGLAQVDVLVVDVGNLAHNCGAVHGHVAHEYHDNLSLEEAVRIYQEIPAERMNGVKGIGFELKDGSDYEG